MRLTKLTALEILEEWWRWLAANPMRTKGAYPLSEKYDFIGNCPCCEYDWTHRRSYCPDDDGKCLLHSLWPDGCTSGDSPYKKWFLTETPRTRKKYALIIAEGAAEEIKKLKGKKK